MDKVYGFKEKDIIDLAIYLKGRENSSLSNIFEEYARVSGKAKGTVRNVYYALAKVSANDKDFRDKYLEGQPISVSKINGFTQDEEKKLAKDVLRAKLQGKSVRKAIMELAGGDVKTALRYQNKFRNMIKKNQETFKEIARELNVEPEMQMTKTLDIFPEKGQKSALLEHLISCLRGEIDGLMDRMAEKLSRENKFLKIRIAYLESQLFKLRRKLPDSQNSLENPVDFGDDGDLGLLS